MPCRVHIAELAHSASLNSAKATGALPAAAPCELGEPGDDEDEDWDMLAEVPL